MASSLNRCCFIGNLVRDVETRYMPSGDALCNFTIACNESWKDKQTGEKKESAEFIRISAFGKLAEICSEYLTQGAKVYCEGKFKTRKYQAADGTDRYATEIRLENMIMLGGRRDDGEGGGERPARNTNAGNGSQRQPQERQGTKTGSAGSKHHGGGPSGGFDEMDDDIPFSPPYRGMQLLSCV